MIQFFVILSILMLGVTAQDLEQLESVTYLEPSTRMFWNRAQTTGDCMEKCPSLGEKFYFTTYSPHDDCGKFCMCVTGYQLVRQCPENKHYSEASNQCMEPEKAQCSTRFDGCKGNCTLNKDGTFKKSFIAHEDCSRFCECKESNGRMKMHYCTEGFHYSVENEFCMRPEDAKCEVEANESNVGDNSTNSEEKDNESNEVTEGSNEPNSTEATNNENESNSTEENTGATEPNSSGENNNVNESNSNEEANNGNESNSIEENNNVNESNSIEENNNVNETNSNEEANNGNESNSIEENNNVNETNSNEEADNVNESNSIEEKTETTEPNSSEETNNVNETNSKEEKNNENKSNSNEENIETTEPNFNENTNNINNESNSNEESKPSDGSIVSENNESNDSNNNSENSIEETNHEVRNYSIEKQDDDGCYGSCPDTSEPYFMVHSDCKKFCACVGGFPVVKNCSAGLYFDEVIRQCVVGKFSRCGNTEESSAQLTTDENQDNPLANVVFNSSEPATRNNSGDFPPPNAPWNEDGEDNE